MSIVNERSWARCLNNKLYVFKLNGLELYFSHNLKDLNHMYFWIKITWAMYIYLWVSWFQLQQVSWFQLRQVFASFSECPVSSSSECPGPAPASVLVPALASVLFPALASVLVLPALACVVPALSSFLVIGCKDIGISCFCF